MTLFGIIRIEPKTWPPEFQEPKKKSRRGLVAGAVALVIVAVALTALFLAGRAMLEDVRDSLAVEIPTPVAEEPTPTTNVPETVPTTVVPEPTPTTAPSTNTTVPEATTTTTLPGFNWGDEPAPLGFLIERDFPEIGLIQATLSGVLLEIVEEEAVALWDEEPQNFFIARFDLGDYPESDERVTGVLVLGVHSEPRRGIAVCQMKNRWLSADPNRPPSGGNDCSYISPEEAAIDVEIGKQYPLEVWLSYECSRVRPDERAYCEEFIEKEGTLLPYNQALVDALRGEGEIPIGFGLLGVLRVPPDS